MKRLLRILGILVGVLALLAAGFVVFVQATWDNRDNRPAPAMVARHDSAAIARGEYIYKYTWQCWGCHVEGGSDPSSPPSGGQLFDLTRIGPGFGKFYSRNITPDSATGLGTWADGEIVQAIREGVRKNRRALFPLMPVDWLHGMSDDDALSIVAYLRSLPPVRKEVPPSAPSFVAKALFAFHVVSAMPAIDGRLNAPRRGTTLEYGKYAATGLAGCADCHTPRDLKNGKFFMDSLFAGGTIPLGDAEGAPIVSYAANLRASLGQGPGQWTEDQFIAAVTTGMKPDGTVLSPHMPYAMYKFLDNEDLRAMYAYFSSLPRVARDVPPTRYTEQVRGARGPDRGNLLFGARCQACHGRLGAGAPATSVKLAEVAGSLSEAELRQFIGSGQASLKMPSFGKTLSSDELDDIVAFIQSWHPAANPAIN
ncbi:MAG TPA: c-type cytochrome [Bacteroidota bacterium]|nr:c-type cytochrome [Bacteroidota bacterium]